MKKLLLVVIVLFIACILNAKEFNTYSMELVVLLPDGEGRGKIWAEMVGPGQDNPSAFVFDKEGNLYISDMIQDKLLKFDRNFDFIAEFFDCYAANAEQLYIDDSGEFISLNNDVSISVDTSSLKKKSFVSLWDSQYKEQFKRNKFMYINGSVYIPLKDGRLLSIDNPGTNNNDNLKKVKKVNPGMQSTSRSSTNTIMVDKRNNLIVDTDIITRDFKSFFSYKNEHQTRGGSKKKLDITLTADFFKNTQMDYLGKDSDKNIYWLNSDAVVIFDKHGQLIEVFIPEPNKRKGKPVIHPDGDVYYIWFDEKKLYLYKIARKW